MHYDITVLYLDFFLKFFQDSAKNLLDHIVPCMYIWGIIVLMQKKGFPEQKNEIKECDEFAEWILLHE